MNGRVFMSLLLLLLTLFTGVCPRRPIDIYVKAGELVALHCPCYRGNNSGDVELIWTSGISRGRNLTSNMSWAEQRQTGMLLDGRSLVILRASANHQGNYSCSLGNDLSQFWFRLTVYTTLSREYEEKTTYSVICYTQETCRLHCPAVNTPDVNTQNITDYSITWHKKGESLSEEAYYSSVEKSDHGVYTCTRSYLYHGQTYNMTFTVVLDVQPNKILGQPIILTPLENDVFHVALGSTVVIDCKAVIYSEFDEVFWLSGNSFVETDDSFPVFYNYTRENNGEGINMTASLVFKQVSEDDLSRNYTCKLESVSEPSNFVTITLAKKAYPLSLSMALCIVGFVVIIVFVTVVVCLKLKMDVAVFLRNTCYCSSSDGKSYDAFLMFYESDTDTGLNEEERERLESVLEEQFGYSLCLFDRDISPGKAEAEAVLDCVDQSRSMVLVPNSSHPCPGGSSLLSAIQTALVERQTYLVFIKTESTGSSRQGSLPEDLQLLCEAGDCVTWRGKHSMPTSSSFWKQLCYYLPAPQNLPKIRPLPQTATLDDNA